MADPSLLELAHLWFPWADPFWSHYRGASPQASPAQRRELDTRTRTRFALARTSYPALARPPQRPAHPARHAPTQRASFPTSWEAFRNPIKATQDYAAAMGQRLALYAHDPIGGMTADFQDIRGRGRINDVVWGAVEDVVAKTPVALAEGFDFVRPPPPKLPDPFNWQSSDHPAPPPRKLAPIVERTMRPLLADAALRPPRTYLEQSTAGTAKVAMLLGEPETAAGEAVAEIDTAIKSGVDTYHELREAGEELRAGLEAGKTWDQAYAALPQRAKGLLGTHWFRVGAGDATEAEEAAGLGARPPRNARAQRPEPQPEPQPPASTKANEFDVEPPSRPLGREAPSPQASALEEGLHPEGTFSIIDWTGYPEDLPRPSGPFRLLERDEYREARRAADRANKALHKKNRSLSDHHLHELHPIKFGGHPTHIVNKINIEPSKHDAVTAWWYRLQRHIEKSGLP